MTADLERRYQRLLRLYPAAYRRERGAELLDTLLEAAAAERPSRRETGHLLLGALRAHVGDTRRSVAESWLSAGRTAALMLLVYATLNAAIYLKLGFGAAWYLELVPIILSGAAIVTILRQRYVLAVTAALGSFVVAAVLHLPERSPSFGDFWQPPLAVLLLLPLLSRRPRPVRLRPATGLLRYVPLAPLLLVAVDFGFVASLPETLPALVVLALIGVALLWVVVDERVPMAVGLFAGNALLNQVTFEVGTGGVPRSTPVVALMQIGIVAALPAVLLLSSGIAARRQARL